MSNTPLTESQKNFINDADKYVRKILMYEEVEAVKFTADLIMFITSNPSKYFPSSPLSEQAIREEAEKLYPYAANNGDTFLTDVTYNILQDLRRKVHIAALTSHPPVNKND